MFQQESFPSTHVAPPMGTTNLQPFVPKECHIVCVQTASVKLSGPDACANMVWANDIGQPHLTEPHPNGPPISVATFPRTSCARQCQFACVNLFFARAEPPCRRCTGQLVRFFSRKSLQWANGNKQKQSPKNKPKQPTPKQEGARWRLCNVHAKGETQVKRNVRTQNVRLCWAINWGKKGRRAADA